MANALIRKAQKLIPALMVLGLAGSWDSRAADVPQADITNGEVHVKLYLPDSQNGYYRGTRFDWSGVIAALEYKGHTYYTRWYDRIDPQVRDWEFHGEELVVSTCSGISGPVEEHHAIHGALGFDEAKVGGTFVKIGVGVLRKDSEKYNGFKLYEIVDPGKWTVVTHPDSVEFMQVVADPSSGYGYTYRKTVRLVPGKPEMVLEHRLTNTGRHVIQDKVYNHDFLALDHQVPGPDLSLTFPFQLSYLRPPSPGLAEIRGNQLVYLKKLADSDTLYAQLLGFSGSPKDHEIRIENQRVGAGVVIRANRPLSNLSVWSIRRVLAVEPFIEMSIDPGSEFTWNWDFQFYTLAMNAK